MTAKEGILRAVRSAGVDPAFIAAQAGLTEQRLYDILRQEGPISASELISICRAIGTTPGDIFSGPD